MAIVNTISICSKGFLLAYVHLVGNLSSEGILFFKNVCAYRLKGFWIWIKINVVCTWIPRSKTLWLWRSERKHLMPPASYTTTELVRRRLSSTPTRSKTFIFFIDNTYIWKHCPEGRHLKTEPYHEQRKRWLSKMLLLFTSRVCGRDAMRFRNTHHRKLVVSIWKRIFIVCDSGGVSQLHGVQICFFFSTRVCNIRKLIFSRIVFLFHSFWLNFAPEF